MQERAFEVFFVDGSTVDTQHHQHLTGVLDGNAVYDLTPSLSHHQSEQSVSQVVSDTPVSHNLLTTIVIRNTAIQNFSYSILRLSLLKDCTYQIPEYD